MAEVESKPPELTRREFLVAAGAAAALSSAGMPPARAAGAGQETARMGPNEKIVVGFIGVAGRGSSLLSEFMAYEDVEVGAVCDAYQPRLEAAVAKTEGKARAYSDFRKLLEQKDLDAVVIATPPQWHPLMSIYACQAGKDVYCEKPICNYPGEARAMLKAARDNKRVTQVGTQVHAGENFRRAVEIVRSGILGKITAVRVTMTTNEYIGTKCPPDSEPPEGLDWNAWLGPAPEVPFNQMRFEAHRYFKDYVGSWLQELGPHIVDLAYWAMEPGEPVAVTASGGRFIEDAPGDIPDTLDVHWEYPDFIMSWHHSMANSYNFGYGAPPDRGRRLNVFFQGTNGTLAANYGSHQIFPEGDRLEGVTMPEPSIPPSPGHCREFLDCIKSRQQPSCSFEYHVPLAVTLSLGHIAFWTGRRIRWDSASGRIIDDEKANRLVYPNYRKPWKLPRL